MNFFPGIKSRKIEVNFSGGNVSSDRGTLLLRQVERKLGLLSRTAKIIVHHDTVKIENLNMMCRKNFVKTNILQAYLPLKLKKSHFLNSINQQNIIS